MVNGASPSAASCRGAADFGVDLTEHIQFEIDAMKIIAADLGLLRGVGGPEES